jgi:hypothetical protein
MKSSSLIPIGLACACVSLARADFNPIPLDPTSFNHDPVIEKAAPKCVTDYTTADPNSGTNKLSTTANGTWFERGYSTVNPTNGFPPHGSLVTHTNSATTFVYTFQMPPDYHTNNCLFIGHENNNNPNWAPIVISNTLTLTTPAKFNYLSVLNASGNGACQIQITVHYAGGANPDVFTFSSTDWWSGNADNGIATRIWDAAGLIGTGGGVNNLTPNHGVIWANDFTLSDSSDNVTSVDFKWLYGSTQGHSPWGNGRTVIFGLAGSTDGINFNPIPVSGFNRDVIYEADAPGTWGMGNNTDAAILTNGPTYCTVTMDGNLAKTGSTWYEKGYYASQPNSGIPTAGSTFTSATRPTVHYTMPASYSNNCAYFLTGSGPGITNATIKFATPTAAGALAFLVGGGNGGLGIRVEIGYQGGTSETNYIWAPDWFTRDVSNACYVAFGRIAPSVRAVNNTPDQFNNAFMTPTFIPGDPSYPLTRDPRNGAGGNAAGAANYNIPGVRLYDAVIPVSNSGSPISTINLVATNITTGGNCATIFAVSGSPGMQPIIAVQPFGLVIDNVTGNTNATTGQAVQNSIIITKGYQGTNNIFLITSNLLSTGVSYQWKKAPRGGGFRDLFDSFDMSTFVNVTAPNVSANTSTLAISNATLADSGDYILVCSNQYGMQTSFVATVMVLTTNYSLFAGAALGDSITKYTADGTSGTLAESIAAVIDQVLQKWLSTGLGGVGIDGTAIAQGTVPFVGPVGFIATPGAGSSLVNNLRFYCANDTPGRDPADYTLEGSNDGTTWTRITGGTLLGTSMLPAGRNGTGATGLNPLTQFLTEVDFANSTFYTSYRVTITNVIDPFVTPLMQIAEIQLLGSFAPAAPVWLLQPLPTLKAYLGSNPTLTALATGQGGLTPHYQWYQFPATLITNATSSAFTRTNIQSADSGTSFYCVAINPFGQIASSSGQFNVVPAPTNSYPTRVLADKPMSYWRLDEAESGGGDVGVIAYDYYGGHNGYYSNVVLGAQGYSTFDPDTAMAVSGTADSLVQGIFGVDFARGAGSTAAFSVEAWAYWNAPALTVTTRPANQPAVVAKGNNGILNTGTGTGTEQYALDYIGGFRFMVRDANGQGYQAQSTSQATDVVTGNPAWHHLLGVCDQPNGNVRLYVDGLLAASNTVSTTAGILTQPLPMTIGSRRDSIADEYDNQWQGTVDDVAVYPYALTPTQALSHFMASQRPPIIQGPFYLLLPLGGGTNWTVANNVPVTFNANAYGPGTLSYQWWNSDNTQPTTPISGANASNYTFTTTAAMNNTFYQLVVTSQYGAVTSAVINLTVLDGAPSFIVDLPSQQNIFLGHIIQLHVNPGGRGPFTYQWQKNGVNIANDYRTSGVLSNTLTIGYANTNDGGNYQVMVTGQQGTTPSTMDAVTVSTNASGFFGASSAPSAWTLNGTPSAAVLYPTNALQMTASLGSTARSAWLNTKQTITSFNAVFVYQTLVNANAGADGVSFCIQNDSRGTATLGGGGGALALDGITPSVALAINIYNPNVRGIAFCQNGAGGRTYYNLGPNVNIGVNVNPVQVNMSYDGVTWAFKFTDTVTGLSVSTNWTVNIPSIVGGNTAYIGFTGADGGVSSTQLTWWPSSGAVVQPTPLRMTSRQVGNTIVLSWPAFNGGYLESSPAIGPSAVWTYSTAPWQLNGDPSTGTQQATVPIGTGSAYLRLLQLAP